MYVVGTAGHIDHGKSALVLALTGIDPDRLREEKERGLTIDLGFAWLTLPSGREVSIVDVPGHERFIKNMVAGAGGIDLAVLVVAADDGPMPQTREHLAILDLLGVARGVVALSKCDRVDQEYLPLVEEEIRQALAGGCLADAPIVRTSAVTREGLDTLMAEVDRCLDQTPARPDLGQPRLPIDRAFTITGFGTVVTGTLVGGSLATGQEVEIQPGGMRARIRSLQRHKSRVERLQPGTRAAVNLSGVHADDLGRGMVVALPGRMMPSRAADVRLRGPSILSHPLRHGSGVTFLSGTSEAEAQLRLLDCDALEPGGEAWAQLLFDRAVPIAPGDSCIVRTANETVAGGEVVGLDPPRRRRNHAPTLAALSRRLSGGARERLLEQIDRGPLPRMGLVERLGVGAHETESAVADLLASGDVVEGGGLVAGARWLSSAAGRLTDAARAFLEANRMRSAAPREHVRSAAHLAPPEFELALEAAIARGQVELRATGIAPAGHVVELSTAQRAEADRYLAALREGGFAPPTGSPPPAELVAHLVETGQAVDVGGGVVFDAGTYQEMVARLVQHLETAGAITLAEVRDQFGTSRKYAQAFLEHLDAEKVTRRSGDTRVLRAREALRK